MDKSEKNSIPVFLDDVGKAFRLSWITETVNHENLKLWKDNNYNFEKCLRWKIIIVYRIDGAYEIGFFCPDLVVKFLCLNYNSYLTLNVPL